ncbi:hypothetical protein BKA70DRAFT_17498 [Coprinopsis sp. MPI-PUGE-AT-0042]|nr:hypothetical protein BKA70DRAFT_17498 [Coprinopsis sp. MPI-PUGE-AT-0042]
MTSSDNRTPKTLPSLSLEGKVCIVTGAARGLGWEFCRAFVDSGCTSLALLDLKLADLQQAEAELIGHIGNETQVKILTLECDVTNEDLVKAAFDKLIEAFGRVDVAVACAGIIHNHTALEYPVDKLKLLYDVNVHGVFYTARQAGKHMIAQGGGSIILIGSMSASIVNHPQVQMPYNVSKAAVKHMASNLGVEWAKHNVRVNCLSPGYILTKMSASVFEGDPGLKKTWEQQTPMGRMGDPEDLAGAIVFMASDASKFMTGAEIKVDGGFTCL